MNQQQLLFLVSWLCIYLELLQNSYSFPLLEKMIRATSASHRTESSYAFFSSPFLRLAKVTCLLILFSILFSSTLPLPILSSTTEAHKSTKPLSIFLSALSSHLFLSTNPYIYPLHTHTHTHAGTDTLPICIYSPRYILLHKGLPVLFSFFFFFFVDFILHENSTSGERNDQVEERCLVRLWARWRFYQKR